MLLDGWYGFKDIETTEFLLSKRRYPSYLPPKLSGLLQALDLWLNGYVSRFLGVVFHCLCVALAHLLCLFVMPGECRGREREQAQRDEARHQFHKHVSAFLIAAAERPLSCHLRKTHFVTTGTSAGVG